MLFDFLLFEKNATKNQIKVLNIEAVKKMIMDNRRTTIREVANDVDISFGSCQAIFMDVLGMKRAATKIFPKLLNFEQKNRRMDVAQEMSTTFND